MTALVRGQLEVPAAYLDQGLKQYFDGSQDEMYFGSVRLQPVAYQDDLGHANKDVNQPQVGNTKLACMHGRPVWCTTWVPEFQVP